MPVSERTFEQVVREDPEHRWELHCGRLVQKPAMTFDHNRLGNRLAWLLMNQLDLSVFDVRSNAGYVYYDAERYYVPDVYVIPLALVEELRGQPDQLELYEEPLPLVVEIWSPSTGGYDVDKKLSAYQSRGDLEIWRIHSLNWGTRAVPQPPPIGAPPRYPGDERTLTSWRWQPDDSYGETLYRDGIVRPVALPGVAVDFETLFG